MDTKIIPSSDIPSLVAALRGASFVSVEYASEKKLLKKDRITKEPHNFGDTATKVSKLHGIVNFDYETSVNNQREREDKESDFTSQGNWFEHTEIRAIVRHKKDASKLYLQFKVETTYPAQWLIGGEPIDHSLLVNLLPKDYGSANQGLDKEVKTVVVGLNSILKINIGGESFQVAEVLAPAKIVKVGKAKV